MERRHFFEVLERENDYQREYEKLEKLCAKKIHYSIYTYTINAWLLQNFLYWKDRSNYCSYQELRGAIGFSEEMNGDGSFKTSVCDGINGYLLFAEMLINIIVGLRNRVSHELEDIIEALFTTIRATIEKAGLEVVDNAGKRIIVEKNPVSTEVADLVPEIADAVIEYNHYLLKGDLVRKKEILLRISDSLEPHKKELKEICNSMQDDFFYLVNNMNIRHNNCDPNDKHKYNHEFAALNNNEKEQWYDLIYEQGLALYVMLEQKNRNIIIKEFKSISVE